MKYLMTEEEAAYMQAYQGHFSRKLASWAISNMEMKDPVAKTMKPVSMRSTDDVMEILKSNGAKIPDECIFDAWYLYMMTIADYQESLPDDKHRAKYVEETIFDHDGKSTSVLSCFAAKMCDKGVAIHWQMFV